MGIFKLFKYLTFGQKRHLRLLLTAKGHWSYIEFTMLLVQTQLLRLMEFTL